MVMPWTQICSLRWPPVLSFYEERIALLRAFEDDGRFVAFRVHADQIVVRLSPWEEIEVRPDGLVLTIAGDPRSTDTAGDTLEYCVRRAVKLLRPPRVGTVTGLIQYVIPTAAPYDKARREAIGRLTNAGLPATTNDFALLLNGDEGDDVLWTVELGVIRAEEGPDRVGRRFGQMTGHPSPFPGGPAAGLPALGGVDNAAIYPEVSFFLDWFWQGGSITGPDDAAVAVRQTWRSIVSATATRSESMANTFVGTMEGETGRVNS